MPKAGKTQTANDYAANMAHVSTTKGQGVPVEKGNNSGPFADEVTLGAQVPEGSYAAGHKDAKNKEG